jgi:MFS family permease
MTLSPVSTRPRTAALVLLCAAQFVVVLDVTIVAVALPAMRHSLGLEPAALQWVLTAYVLTFGGLLVAAGRAADLFGRRRLLSAGLVVFGGASLACGLAASGLALVAARAVQGTGAAMLSPAAFALLVATFAEPAARRRAVAWWTAAAAGGGAVGWLIGGALVQTFGWPAVFLVNVPLCALALLLAPHLLAESRADGPRQRLDLAGAVAVTAGLALLMHGLTRVDAAGAAVSLAGGVLALAAFARIERRAEAPILPAWALRRPGFGVANGAAAALCATTTPAMFLAILYQQEVLHRSALEVGLWCTPLNLAVIAGSLLRPRWSPRAVMACGLAAIAAGALTLAALSSAALPAAFVLMGAGLGCASVASTASGTAALPESAQGIASGVLTAAAQLGTAVGLAVIVTLAEPLGYRGAFATVAAVAIAVAASVRWRLGAAYTVGGAASR